MSINFFYWLGLVIFKLLMVSEIREETSYTWIVVMVCVFCGFFYFLNSKVQTNHIAVGERVIYREITTFLFCFSIYIYLYI